ncbi:MAG: hypothetical protein Q8P57_05040 [Candidatus Pacearchaeota archaeon]|nr:hypothetical protein [Candidatus Pacearchaeota archaeon]
MKRKIIAIWIVFLLVLSGGVFYFNTDFVFAQGSSATVCCEQTNTGASCQNVPAEECAPGARAVPTSCDSTSYCRPGVCYDSSEGICLDNTPQLVCNDNGGVWSEESPPQCALGCCILGDQAAFVSLVRCKKLSASLGLKTNYDTSVQNELACIQKVQTQERGACVYEFEFEKTCEFTTRSECEGSQKAGTGESNITITDGNFYSGKLCSAEELGTNCGPTTQTTCNPGNDEVYFIDSCGNTANIYDASKVNDAEYWTNIKPKDESCSPGSGNAGSSSCGNCNYLEGSYCRAENIAGKSATYGDFICADLNCKDTENGNDYLHGESWCVNDDFGSIGDGKNTVGSRFYRHLCINGEEVLEQCSDFRAEECIQEETSGFSQAVCKVNRWQYCAGQTEQRDCENEDKGDCFWKEGVILQTNTTERTGSCFPENSPGFNFWDDAETLEICSQGNAVCIVKFEEGLFGGEECVEGCECLTEEWEKDKGEICSALGDCGPSLNWLGRQGYDSGYKVTSEEI